MTHCFADTPTESVCIEWSFMFRTMATNAELLINPV